MKSVTLFSEVDNTVGALGYSIIQNLWGEPRRMTLLYLRDHNGIAKGTVIAPAETLREVIF